MRDQVDLVELLPGGVRARADHLAREIVRTAMRDPVGTACLFACVAAGLASGLAVAGGVLRAVLPTVAARALPPKEEHVDEVTSHG